MAADAFNASTQEAEASLVYTVSSRWASTARYIKDAFSYHASQLCWPVFCQLDISWSHLGRQNLNWENASIRLACRQVWRAFSWLKIDVGEPSPLWVVKPLSKWSWVILKSKPRFSVVVSICCKEKVLWWGVNTTLICEYKNKCS